MEIEERIRKSYSFREDQSELLLEIVRYFKKETKKSEEK